jgi:hypothetical protein
MCSKRIQGGRTETDRSTSIRVIDDFADGMPILPAELDAIEAFLMATVNRIMADKSAGKPVKSEPFCRKDSETPQSSARF